LAIQHLERWSEAMGHRADFDRARPILAAWISAHFGQPGAVMTAAVTQSTPGMEEEFKVNQIGLHRAISGHSLAASLDHLTAAAKQVAKDAQSRQETIRVAKIPDAELIISADVRFAGEAVLHVIGSAVVQAQKQVGAITGLVKDIGEACVRFGYGPLCARRKRRAVECISRRRHGTEGPLVMFFQDVVHGKWA
jgi:hypothetical protein